MIRGIAAGASSPVAALAAEEALAAGGSAVDALVAGMLAAAGDDAGVLFAPAIALVGGAGAGVRAFDGRSAQPGRGAPRPRGFVRAADIPIGARVATPRAPAMLVLLHTYFGRARLHDLARPGAAAANSLGASRRAALITSFGVQGIRALHRDEVTRALDAVAGPIAGGLLGPADLVEALPTEAEAHVASIAGGVSVLTSPWDAKGARPTEAIVAVDARGLFAALAYAPNRAELVVPELEITVDLSATPVRRGVQRVAPGTPVDMPAPIALLSGGSGGPVRRLAIGLGGGSFTPDDLAQLAAAVVIEAEVIALAARPGARFAVVATGDGKTARTLLADKRAG